MEGDEQKTVKASGSHLSAETQQQQQPDASKLRKMSMSQDNAQKLAREQFKYVFYSISIFLAAAFHTAIANLNSGCDL